MSRPALFTQADITKVLKGAHRAGLRVSRVEIDRTGKIIAQIADADNDAEEPNEWDVVLHAKEKRAS